MSEDRRAFFRAMVRSAAGQAPPAPAGLRDDEVERYSRQLHERDEEQYLAMKKREYAHQAKAGRGGTSGT